MRLMSRVMYSNISFDGEFLVCCFKFSDSVWIKNLNHHNYNSIPFPLSIQPLTALAILSYGKRDFAGGRGS